MNNKCVANIHTLTYLDIVQKKKIEDICDCTISCDRCKKQTKKTFYIVFSEVCGECFEHIIDQENSFSISEW